MASHVRQCLAQRRDELGGDVVADRLDRPVELETGLESEPGDGVAHDVEDLAAQSTGRAP